MPKKTDDFLNRAAASGLILLSAATLLYEVLLTRFFSVSQFYHFAFMIVSLALLGFGVSGTILAIFPSIRHADVRLASSGFSCGASLTMLGSYILINKLLFDSFSIAWDLKQTAILTIHYLALSLPFFFSGLATGLLLTCYPSSGGKIYAWNMLGSATGCAMALAVPIYLGGEGSILFACMLASAATVCFLLVNINTIKFKPPRLIKDHQAKFYILITLILLLFGSWHILNLFLGKNPFSLLELHLSPYKSLSYALQYPDARIISSKWNAISRVDVVSSNGIRSLPGISYQFFDSPPHENGLLVDGDDLSPIITNAADGTFSDYMPSAIAYRLRPHARSLVLDSHGGIEVLVAHHQGAASITAVEPNPLIIDAADSIYHLDEVQKVSMSSRSYANQATEQYDVIVLALNNSYHPVNSGAYSLTEDYRYTIEAVQAYLQLLTEDGILVIHRWLQSPPSEFLRAFIMAAASVEAQEGNATTQITAFRSYNMGTLLVKRHPFTSNEINEVLRFSEELSFDTVFFPGIEEKDANRFNRLPSPQYYLLFQDFLNAEDRTIWLENYPYDMRPPTDNHPFFSHYFKWSQTAAILNSLGKTWQPFGGAGYFVILIFLLLALVMSALLILLPAFLHGKISCNENAGSGEKDSALRLSYFIFIGLGFLLVELPLIQYFILFLDYPAYALTIILFTLLFFSGLGSRYALHIPRRYAHAGLVTILISMPWLLPYIFHGFLRQVFVVRLLLSIGLVAPAGFLMGTMFPHGIYDLQKHQASLIPWAWGANGSASVVASALAALLSLSFGFRFVLWAGAFCYIVVWILVERLSKLRPL